MKKLICALILLSVSGTAYAETIQLNTYYPAPFGAYDRLRLVPRTTIPSCTAALEGSLYYDDTLNVMRICRQGATWGPVGVWTLDSATNSIFPNDTATNPNLRVGIGTVTPSR